MTNLVFTVRTLSLRDFSFVFRLILLASIIFFFSACNASSSEPTSSDYDKLCDIYKNVVEEFKDTNDPLIREGNLAQRIQAKIPNMMEYFGHIISVAPEERYKLFQQIAEHQTKKKWNCPAAESFYSGTQYN